MFTKLTCCLLLLLAVGAAQARADSDFEIIGTVTIPGNSANPGVSETIKFSFELDYSSAFGGSAPVVGTPVITSFGPLGGQFMVGEVHELQNYVELSNQTAAIDIYGSFNPFLAPVPEVAGTALLYSCDTAITPACSEFQIPPYNDLNNESGPVTASVYAVPTAEPGTLCLFVLGALGLCLVKKTLAL